MTPRVGVDVAAIPRIAEAQKRFGDRFLRKFLTDREIEYCGGSAERWAGRWAAKEAIGKAMPSGVVRPNMRDVEILPSGDGRPHVRVAPATTLTGHEVDVSIAHDGHFAVAVAVIPDLAEVGIKSPPPPAAGRQSGVFRKGSDCQRVPAMVTRARSERSSCWPDRRATLALRTSRAWARHAPAPA